MKFDITQLKEQFLGKGKDHTKINVNPARGWKILVLVFFSINLLIITFSIYRIVYRDDLSEGVAREQTAGNIKTINREELQRVLQTYGEKEKTEGRLRIERIHAIDPAE
ncbi:MAG: hypothetical protein NUV42_02175 [Candidatus Yonathbacteria bacterium]|nr:hypothetical protein [Candidatus Yonathbacteria bacterium]